MSIFTLNNLRKGEKNSPQFIEDSPEPSLDFQTKKIHTVHDSLKVVSLKRA
jgi:hypothetical protein